MRREFAFGRRARIRARTRKSGSVSTARCSLNVRVAPKATELLRRREMTRWANKRNFRTGFVRIERRVNRDMGLYLEPEGLIDYGRSN